MMTAAYKTIPRGFAHLVVLVLGILFIVAIRPPTGGADFDEYAAMAVAFAEHGTPDIRVTDLEKASALFPNHKSIFDTAISGIRAGQPDAKPGITRGRDGSYYAIHFAAYSALVALPLKAVEALGLSGFRAFQLVNAGFILVLGLAMRRFFGSWGRAWGAVALFLMCGGILYYKSGSPEFMTAAALLAAMALYLSGAPLRGGFLAGLAGMQNPPLVAFIAFAPLLGFIASYDRSLPLRVNVLRALAPRYVAGVALTAVMIGLPILANLYQFGVPSLIGKVGADVGWISMTRFWSLLLDPNQGMVVAIPGVLAGVALYWARREGGRVRRWLLLAAIAAFTVAMAVPTLATTNWNSGAGGVMRYGFWLAMPLLFALVWRLKQMAHFPWVAAMVIGVVQLAAVVNMSAYHYLSFSPAAHWALRHVPNLYMPEPELFAERLTGQDGGLDPSKTYVYEWQGQSHKVLYHLDNVAVSEKLCGPGGTLQSPTTATDRGWRYVTGTPLCGGPLNVDDFVAGTAVKLGQGWSRPEKNGGLWDGVWSDGRKSSLALVPPAGSEPSRLGLRGNYFGGNTRTRVIVNGRDYGWLDLGAGAQIEIIAPRDGGALQVELEHASPAQAAGDPRWLALFLRHVSLN